MRGPGNRRSCGGCTVGAVLWCALLGSLPAFATPEQDLEEGIRLYEDFQPELAVRKLGPATEPWVPSATRARALLYVGLALATLQDAAGAAAALRQAFLLEPALTPPKDTSAVVLREVEAARSWVRTQAETRVKDDEAKRQAEAAAKRQADERALAEAEAKRQADERALAEAEAKRQAEAKALAEAEAKRQADERARLEAEARRQAEERARLEAEAKRQADERARLEAEARRQAEEKARQEAAATGATPPPWRPGPPPPMTAEPQDVRPPSAPPPVPSPRAPEALVAASPPTGTTAPPAPAAPAAPAPTAPTAGPSGGRFVAARRDSEAAAKSEERGELSVGARLLYSPADALVGPALELGLLKDRGFQRSGGVLSVIPGTAWGVGAAGRLTFGPQVHPHARLDMGLDAGMVLFVGTWILALEATLHVLSFRIDAGPVQLSVRALSATAYVSPFSSPMVLRGILSGGVSALF